MKALIIDTPWINYLLEGKKTWEMRSTATKIRGTIYLVKKGSGLIVGTANVVDSLGPFSEQELFQNIDKHCIPKEKIPSILKWCYAWVLEDIKALDKPIPYNHPQGAVIWVNIL
jgi:ASCH domain